MKNVCFVDVDVLFGTMTERELSESNKIKSHGVDTSSMLLAAQYHCLACLGVGFVVL
jgi:hypothetical protein